MINQPEYIAQLIKKLYDGSLSEAEKLELNGWIESNPNRKTFIEGLNQNDQLFEEALKWIKLEFKDKDEWIDRLSFTTLDKIHKINEIPDEIKPKRGRNLFWYAAAAILLCSSLTFLWIQYQDKSYLENNKIALGQILPGKYQATLILPNGEKIALSENNDLLQISNNLVLSYGNGNEIIDLKDKVAEDELISLSIPRAGHYKVKLSDGTQIWVNSESSISFPLRFTNERQISLDGEAFFDVKTHTDAQNNKIPFKVKADNQLIEVTGTKFNVYAFKKEDIKTTLVEGSVNVHSPLQSISLIPNEQSTFSSGGLQKSKIDVGTEVAWKDNLFYFDETSLKSAMTQLSRWYDLEIIYKGKIPNTYFYGEFSRDQPLQDVLKILEEADVKFEFENIKNKNYLIVLP